MLLEDYKGRDGKKVRLNADERDLLLEVYRKNPGRRIGLDLMVRCGCRCQEAVDTQSKDIFLDDESGRHFLQIASGEASKGRKTPIPDDLVEDVRKYAASYDPEDPVIGVGTRTLRRWVEHASDQLRADTGDDRWRHVRPSDLRRTWGVLTLEHGVHPSVVMKWGGWADYEVFEEEYLRIHALRTQSKEAERFVPRDEDAETGNGNGFGDAIQEFVNQTNRILETQPWTDEANTKRKIVDPFIALLGWDMLSQDVVLEYSEVGSGIHDKVDYVLFGDSQPQIMLEAKRQDKPIRDKEIAQLKKYMRIHRCECGVITNGRRYIVFLDPEDSKIADMERLVDCKLRQLPDHRSELSELAKK